MGGVGSEEQLVSAISSLCARRWLFLPGVALAKVLPIREMRLPGLLLFRRVARNFCHLVYWAIGASDLWDVESAGQVDS